MDLYLASGLDCSLASSTCCKRYLDRLPISTEERRALLQRAGNGRPESREAMAELHQALAGQAVDRDHPAYASVAARVGLAYGPSMDPESLLTMDAQGRVHPITTPPLRRTPMAPESWPPNRVFRLPQLAKNGRRSRHAEPGAQRSGAADIYPDAPDPHGFWHRIGAFRRSILLGLVLTQTSVATYFMTTVLPYHGGEPLEIASLSLFAILTCWVSVGFWTAVMGFLLLILGGRRSAISRTANRDAPIAAHARTAIVMPICNEEKAGRAAPPSSSALSTLWCRISPKRSR